MCGFKKQKKALTFYSQSLICHCNALVLLSFIILPYQTSALPDGVFGLFNARKSYPFILLQNRRLEICSKTHSKDPRFHLKPSQKSISKMQKKNSCFFDFRLLDYLSSVLTVGYTIFDELCRYYFVVCFQKIFE